MSMDFRRFWSAIFFSSLVYVSSGAIRWSSKVFLLFLLRRLRLSLLVRPVSSSSSSPSALMSSLSCSSLSLGESESERSAPDDSGPSSAMWSEGRRRCFLESVLVGRVAPAREEERRRAETWSSVMVGTGGWINVAIWVRWGTLGPSSESMLERELLEGREGRVLSGNSFPGLSSGPCGATESCSCSQRVMRVCSEVMLRGGAVLIRLSPSPPRTGEALVSSSGATG